MKRHQNMAPHKKLFQTENLDQLEQLAFEMYQSMVSMMHGETEQVKEPEAEPLQHQPLCPSVPTASDPQRSTYTTPADAPRISTPRENPGSVVPNETSAIDYAWLKYCWTEAFSRRRPHRCVRACTVCGKVWNGINVNTIRALRRLPRCGHDVCKNFIAPDAHILTATFTS